MESINYYSKIGTIIKDLRIKKNMSRKQLAEGICSKSYITRIENGERCPTSVILRQLTNRLGINSEYLFRAIESPTALDLKVLIDQLTYYIERDDFESIYNLLENLEEQRLEIASIYDLQFIKGLKCFSHTMLNHDYKSGIKETKKILELTYSEGSTPTDVEFPLLFNIGFFLLLNGQKQEAFNHLIKIKKYTDQFEPLHTRAIIPKYYVYLISSCLDTLNLTDANSYLETAISYCKNYNILNLLRELFFLKSELYYRLEEEKEFKLWFDKAMSLNELIKSSDNEYFNSFIKLRLNKLNINLDEYSM